MSYMELKRRHQDLLSDVATLEEKSKEKEQSHWTQINEFAKEIEHSKVRHIHLIITIPLLVNIINVFQETNLALKEEITSYQGIIVSGW